MEYPRTKTVVTTTQYLLPTKWYPLGPDYILVYKTYQAIEHCKPFLPPLLKHLPENMIWKRLYTYLGP